MNRYFGFAMALVSAAMIISTTAGRSAWADSADTPSDQPQVSITRNPSSPLELQTTLSQNVYNYVERTIWVTVQVPYTVEVPYQETETYYTTERQCHLVTVSQNVCQYHQECSERQICEDFPVCESHQECESRQVCEGFGPRRTCHMEQSCRPVQNCHEERRCHMENECHNVPECHIETHEENQCMDVQIPHIRVVTKYREETRYRSEQQQRTVTDAIYDHQWGLKVAVDFPEASALEGSEEETVLVSLQGSETAPDADVSVDSPIFSYKIVNKVLKDGLLTIQLDLVPKYSSDDLGTSTVTGLTLAESAQGADEIQFTDSGAVDRATTEYFVEILDVQTGKSVFSRQLSASFGSKQVAIPVQPALDERDDHVVKLRVHREGEVISGVVDFTQQSNELAQLDPAPYQDPKSVGQLVYDPLAGRLQFVDSSPVNAYVDSKYEIALSVASPDGSQNAQIGSVQLDRKDLQANSAGVMEVAMQASSDALQLLEDPSNQVQASISVTRTSDRLAAVSPIQFTKQAQVKISSNLASFWDPSRLKDFALQVSANDATLSFTDATAVVQGMDTQYDVKFSHRLWGFLWHVTDGEGTVDRADLKARADGELQIAAGQFVSPQDLAGESGNLYLDVSVTRTDDAISGVFPVNFSEPTRKIAVNSAR